MGAPVSATKLKVGYVDPKKAKGGKSPTISPRVAHEDLDEILRLAAESGVRKSVVARYAIERFVREIKADPDLRAAVVRDLRGF